MSNIEVGDYVRTKKGLIARVKFVEYDEIDKGHKELDVCEFDKPIYYDYGEGYYNLYDNEEFEEIIAKHSKNIIDLIEKYDFVNGKRVIKIMDYEEFKKICFDEDFDDVAYEEDIKSIVTKEQFKAIEYEVE